MLQTVSQYSASDIEDSYIYDFAVLPISLKDKYTDTCITTVRKSLMNNLFNWNIIHFRHNTSRQEQCKRTHYKIDDSIIYFQKISSFIRIEQIKIENQKNKTDCPQIRKLKPVAKL